MNQPIYIEIRIKTEFENIEPMAARLFEIGMESSWEESEELIGYFDETIFDETEIKKVVSQFQTTNFSYATIEQKNWNEEWEKNFEPVIVDNQLFIRADMHAPKPEIPLEIVINPKMSFGTGHHATTFLMSRAILNTNFEAKNVIDAGCGTGILTILADMKGAAHVDGFDIEDWTCDNAIENALINNCKHVKIQCGKINEIVLFDFYDIILANINKNVLIAEMKSYSEKLKTGGKLFLSGFYQKDIEDIESCAIQNQFKKYNQDIHNDWSCLYLEKI